MKQTKVRRKTTYIVLLGKLIDFVDNAADNIGILIKGLLTQVIGAPQLKQVMLELGRLAILHTTKGRPNADFSNAN